ncbi:two-component system sensor histidine kinase PmrB [Pantoea sp. 1.19]|uniref:two-component system sensor histidine kinase PmrB n=1 Tax=Pantoea sp. 1.19 TaxID=1925589 RepID=UPI000948F4D0|nr:two-component system sensor histidine kinase PmrB [Pantoea sp. 1.19]
MNSMRRRLMLMLALILLTCQLMSVFWLWHESREQIGYLVNETLSAQARNDRVEGEIREAVAALLLPSVVMLGFTLLLSFWAISWIIRPLRDLQRNLSLRAADNLSPLQLTSDMDEVVSVTTALNQLLGRLDRNLQQERLFTADAAHELRTPLAGLRLHLELLQQRGVSESSALIARLDQLMHVVEQLLMLSRAGQALASGQYRTHDWQRDILAPLLPEMEELLAQRHQPLRCEGDGALLVQGDATLLRLMLRNLLENASRYAPPSSQIRLTLRPVDGGCEVSVLDEGPGIDESMASDLTQAFRRMDQRYGGSGLGLNIVQRIIQLHRGTLTLKNRRDGNGLCARCWLPATLD